jgi:hypothetical protein
MHLRKQDVQDAHVVAGVHEHVGDVTADESGPARDQHPHVLHGRAYQARCGHPRARCHQVLRTPHAQRRRPLGDEPSRQYHRAVADQPELRASDQDRDEVIDALAEHAAAGRLTLAEHEERVERALAARTRAELEPLTRDLPAIAPPPQPRRKATRWLVAFLGGSDRKGRWRVGEQVTAVAVMGGSTLDLRAAEIDAGEVTINAFAVLGGHDIYVPDSVEVEMGGLAIMGGNDQRGSNRPARPGAPIIRVRAYSLMGGTDVWRLPAQTRHLPLREARRQAKALER